MSTEPAPEPATPAAVLISAGAPIDEAAAWVGAACWSELRFHEVLTAWLGGEADVALSQVLWTIRSHRAELAEQWHRRLPELREMPRASFVAPGDSALAARLDEAEVLREGGSSAERAASASSVLAALRDAYRARQGVAIGPADGPTAATLAHAVAVTDDDLARLGQVTGSE